MPRKSLRGTLHELNERGRLALFVGAGISMGCGLPDWKTLVDRILDNVWEKDPILLAMLKREGNLHAARYSKQQAGQRFNRIVHQCLYEGDFDISGSVHAIAKSGIRQICNFNFDDLLEEALLTSGIDPLVATLGGDFKSQNDRVTVFHPHGILARYDSQDEVASAKIVFSEDDYNYLYSDPYSWANIIQLTLLTGYSVLFIGLSLQDPNLRRLIDVARSRGFNNQHFAIFRDPRRELMDHDKHHREKFRKMKEMDLKCLGITPWFVDDHEAVAEILESIAIPHEYENSNAVR